MLTRWLPGLIAGVILSLFSLYPQFNLKSIRGADYNGAFASCDLDEMAYASFLQALIDGRPRQSDPYTGRDGTADNPQSESLFSIQFVPAYMAAIPARVLGLNASQIMPVVSVASAFLATLALYWLMLSMLEDPLMSMAGTLIVMVGSAAIVGLGALSGFFEGGAAYPFFPFLRRPIPSLAFPFFFAYFACLWNGLNSSIKRLRWIYLAASAVLFPALVFSYFYLWTAAAAVVGGLFVFVLVSRSDSRRSDLLYLAQHGALFLVALVPYTWLLSNRNKMADKAQLLVLTHAPDLLRRVEIIGVVALVFVLIAFWRGFVKVPLAAFVAALLLSPVLVFNQQVLTGRSLQPFHYEYYVINYVLLTGLVMLVTALWRHFVDLAKWPSRAALAALISAAVLWGFVEAVQTTSFWDDVNGQRDDAMLVNKRLRELASGDIATAKTLTTLNLESIQADSQPTIAPQPVLWARHQHTFAGVESWDENRRRYYQLLYFMGYRGAGLKRLLTGCEDIEACMALFGWDRFNATLSADARPLTMPEVEKEAVDFERFTREFGPGNAYSPMLSYLIVYSDAENRFENIDRWYQRDSGEVVGKYTLYRLTSRQ
ncbi:MAG: hypothetical protein ABI999_00050 [Acidobacteriota bacterium]